MAVEFRLLGSVEVRAGGRLIDVGHARQRCVLAVLLAEANRVVAAGQLVDRVWGGHRLPISPVGALQTYISLLRRAVAPAGEVLIVRQASGYKVVVDEDMVDLHRFRSLIARARAVTGDDDGAAESLEEALGLWRGEPFAGLDTPWINAAGSSLAMERQAARLDLTDIQLRRGQHAALVSDLSFQASDHPLDERAAGQLMLALYRSGRQAGALEHYEQLRRRLADELGADPGPSLRQLHQQILAADPALDVPAVSTLAASAGPSLPPAPALEVRYSLPPDTVAFTGRDEALDRITTAAADSAEHGRIAGIQLIEGMPGAGKTALAVHAAHVLRDQFPDRCLFIDLHAHTSGRDPVSPTEALAGLLAAVGVDARSLPDDVAGRAGLWRDRMAGRRALLVLDNAASSGQVTPLLPGDAGCLVLVTSRRHLGDLPGPVAPLLLPTLPPGQAREMFARLAPRAAAGPSAVVDELVALAGCLPLAVSLLARVCARHPSWTLADLAAETRTSMLTLAAENDSVGAAFAVSYRSLAPGQQRFLRHLGLHPGSTADAYAASALAGVSLPEAAGYLDGLHGEGLLTEAGYRRYAMHDLIRRYAGDLAAADPAGDREHALERLMDYYQHTAALAGARLARQTPASTDPAAGPPVATVRDLPDPVRALAWARDERASLLACLDHATQASQHARVVGLTASIAALLRHDGPWTDAITRHAAAEQAARHLGDRPGRASALHHLGDARRLTGDYPGAGQALGEALVIYRDLGDRLGQASILQDLGGVRWLTGDYPGAGQVLDEALCIYRDLGDRLGQANTLHDLGGMRCSTGSYPAAGQALDEALSIYRDLGDRRGEANVLTLLGIMWQDTGNYRDAGSALEEALGISRDLGSRLGQANALDRLGTVRLRTGNYQDAARAMQEALSLYRDLGDRVGQANALKGIGALRRETGNYRAAAQALQEALDICGDLGDRGGKAVALNELGALHRVCGDLRRAGVHHQQALDLAREIGSTWDEAHALAGLGRCALAAGDPAGAQAALARALHIFQQAGAADAASVATELDAIAMERRSVR
jgi:DNA-binding SARP family transcriptional activator/tetratricopeptide (TPR) repeat protein